MSTRRCHVPAGDTMTGLGRMRSISTPWLYGSTGKAFIICMHPAVCPNATYILPIGDLTRLCRNIGCRLTGFQAKKSDLDFADKQEAAWQHVRKSIDNVYPCYGPRFGKYATSRSSWGKL